MPGGILKAGSGPSNPLKRKHGELTSPIRKPTQEGPAQKKPRTQGAFGAPGTPTQRPAVDPSMHAAYDKMAHEEMLKNPKYQKLADDALKNGSVNVVTKEQAHGGMFYGDRKLGLQPELTGPKRASVMAFELTNAVHQPRFSQVRNQAFRDGVTQSLQGKKPTASEHNAKKEQFAKDMERIEYDGIHRHHEVVKHGIDNHGWPPEMDRFGKRLEGPNPGFDSYWDRQNVKNTKTGKSHSDVYRDEFERLTTKTEEAADKMRQKKK